MSSTPAPEQVLRVRVEEDGGAYCCGDSFYGGEDAVAVAARDVCATDGLAPGVHPCRSCSAEYGTIRIAPGDDSRRLLDAAEVFDLVNNGPPE